jgi:hypothetical protein
VERAFRDLKDRWVGAFLPQYHWTDQKLIVHALIAVWGLRLGRLLLRRAPKRAGYRGTLRSLAELKLVTVFVPGYAAADHYKGGRDAAPAMERRRLNAAVRRNAAAGRGLTDAGAAA